MDEERALKPGITSTVIEEVTATMTADSLGSGDVPVLGTPALAALAERAAVEAVRPALVPGTTTVGAGIQIDHLAPTPVGARITVETVIETLEGRRITFSFRATDDSGLVARGRHRRVVVDRDTFVREAGAHRSSP